MVLSLQTRIGLIQCYYENGRSFSAAFRRFRTRNGLRVGPCSLSSYQKLVSKFEETGSVTDAKKSGRPSVGTDVTVAEVLHETQNLANENQYGICSVNKVARRLEMSSTTVWRILRRQLKLYPYKIQILFELKERDKATRNDFALLTIAQIQANPQWLDNVFWTDEAHFQLNGGVNTHNCRIWSSNNRHLVIQQGLHDLKVTVWCGFTSRFIIGPYFFEENAAGETKTVTVNGERYLNMLHDYAIPSLRHQNIENIIFMQDGAPPHIFKPVKQFLSNTFGDRVISRQFPVTWPARSPDINPADYWLWGDLKERVFLSRPTSIHQLKESITQIVTEIPELVLRAAVYNIEERLLLVQEEGGGHIHHLR